MFSVRRGFAAPHRKEIRGGGFAAPAFIAPDQGTQRQPWLELFAALLLPS
jgi:hypothetical protein